MLSLPRSLRSPTLTRSHLRCDHNSIHPPHIFLTITSPYHLVLPFQILLQQAHYEQCTQTHIFLGHGAYCPPTMLREIWTVSRCLWFNTFPGPVYFLPEAEVLTMEGAIFYLSIEKESYSSAPEMAAILLDIRLYLWSTVVFSRTNKTVLVP